MRRHMRAAVAEERRRATCVRDARAMRQLCLCVQAFIMPSRPSNQSIAATQVTGAHMCSATAEPAAAADIGDEWQDSVLDQSTQLAAVVDEQQQRGTARRQAAAAA